MFTLEGGHLVWPRPSRYATVLTSDPLNLSAFLLVFSQIIRPITQRTYLVPGAVTFADPGAALGPHPR